MTYIKANVLAHRHDGGMNAIQSLLALLCLPSRATQQSDERLRTTHRRYAVASPEPRTSRHVLGVQLALHDSDGSGARPVIFCLHAVGHGGSDFVAFERAFADRYRIITVDWPGQGASGPDSVAASAQRYTSLFSELVRQLDVGPFIVLGNSIGGSVAIRYAAAHPERVRALILTDSAGLDQNPGGFVPNLFMGQIERKLRRGVALDPAFSRWFRDFYEGILITPAARAQRDAIIASGYEIAPVLAQAWQSFRDPGADVRALARGLRMPVFVGWSKRDDIIRWSRNRAAVMAIPNVQVQLFEAGHAPFLETPEPFNRAVAKFLARCEGR